MSDFLFQMGLSNACFSFGLAIAAMIVGARAKRPQLAYLLWLLVFVKLVTPPIVTFPVGMPSRVASTSELPTELQLPLNSELVAETQSPITLAAQVRSCMSNIPAKLSAAKPSFAIIWLLGTCFIVAWSVHRVVRFSRLLQENIKPAPHQLQATAVTISKQLGINRLPEILTTSAHLSPMVWWAGGKVRVVIPASLLDEMDASQWRWVLAHELAHVQRRDYLVRWLEWLACAGFWWNPVVWWAQRNLRSAEEICCDALVLSCLKPKPRSYANSLLTAVELLACPAIRPPAMASEINSGGSLERRFRMIVSENRQRVTSRGLQAVVLLCAIVVLPLGMVNAQNYEAVGKRLKAAVQDGEITGAQARIMLGALKEAGGATQDQTTDKAKAYLANLKQELGAAVEAGKMSKEDAVKKYQAAEKAVKQRLAAGEGKRDEKRVSREDLERVGAEIREAVAAGKISKEEGRKKMAAMRKKLGDQGKEAAPKTSQKELEHARAEIREAIAAGKITEEQGRERIAAMRKKFGEQGEAAAKKVSQKDVEHAWAEIREAVAAGKITEEQGRERIAAMRKKFGEQGKDVAPKAGQKDLERAGAEIREAIAAGKTSPEEGRKKMIALRKKLGAQTEDAGKKEIRKDLAEATAKIRQAVADGKISAEDGRAKLRAMRKKTGEQSGDGTKKKDVDWAGIKQRIEDAVKSGEITREEANAKHKELRKRMAGGREG